jgi:galactose-1-phosphate uridylyltransferase
MFDKMNGVGAHEVIIETPEHALTLAEMPEHQIKEVLWAYKERICDLKRDTRFKYIMLFKNHGEAAGASLEHPHSQLIALPVVPKRVKEEVDGAQQFYSLKERCIYCDIIRQETVAGVRLVMQSERFTVIQPYAPRFPFETWILPKKHESHFEESDSVASAGYGVGAAVHDAKDRQGAGAAGVQFHAAQRAGAGRAAALLPLARGDHSQADADGGVRMGDRVLHQSHTARGIGAVSGGMRGWGRRRL